MQIDFVKLKELKSLEEYAIALSVSINSLKTIENFHESALNSGLLADDMIMRSKLIIWDLRRSIGQTVAILNEVLELIPDDFDLEGALKALMK